MDNESGKKRGKIKRFICYSVGCLAVFVSAVAILPTLIEKTSGQMYKAELKKSNSTEDDDWGPVIEKK